MDNKTSFSFFICFLWALQVPGEGFDLSGPSVITDPGLSRRCRTLLEDRNNKVKVKQSLDALLLRNRHLQDITPQEKESLLRDLLANQALVERKIALASLRIQRTEEALIRRGCPGLERAQISSSSPESENPNGLLDSPKEGGRPLLGPQSTLPEDDL